MSAAGTLQATPAATSAHLDDLHHVGAQRDERPRGQARRRRVACRLRNERAQNAARVSGKAQMRRRRHTHAPLPMPAPRRASPRPARRRPPAAQQQALLRDAAACALLTPLLRSRSQHLFTQSSRVRRYALGAAWRAQTHRKNLCRSARPLPPARSASVRSPAPRQPSSAVHLRIRHPTPSDKPPHNHPRFRLLPRRVAQPPWTSSTMPSCWAPA